MSATTETAAVTDPPHDKGDFPGGSRAPDKSKATDIDITVDIDTAEAGCRFDQAVSAQLPEWSRNAIIKLIREGRVRLNDAIKKPGHRLQPNDRITGNIPASVPPCLSGPLSGPTGISAPAPESMAPKPIDPEPIDLDIIYDDASLIVINKPPGLVVHPAPGHAGGTLAHGLRHHFPETANAGPPDRPGIVHRIDKGTSGLLLAAKTEKARLALAALFKTRKIEKTYLAFVYGSPAVSEGLITHRIARHKKDRKKMAVSDDPAEGRDAYTAWHVLERFEGVSLLRLRIKTGRTHQIRVHCRAMGHPVVGDDTYGYKKPLKAFMFTPKTAALIKTIDRPLLHASTLTFAHPETGAEMTFEAPLPADMALFHQSLK